MEKLLVEATLQELIDEIERRSIGSLIVAMTIESGNSDSWDFGFKGSPVMVDALYHSLGEAIAMGLEEDVDAEDD